MTDFPVTVFHNPACGTSRNAVEMARAAGYAPTVVEYLQAGWDRAALAEMIRQAGLTPRQALREKGTPAAELGLLEPRVADDRILDAMVEHPILVNRPFVITPKGTVLARPSERVFEVLERRPDRFVKEDGEVVELGRHVARSDDGMSAEAATTAVRPAAPEDAAAIAEIYNQGIADRLGTFETEPRTPAAIGAWFDGRHPVVTVVDPSGAVIAFAASFPYAARRCYAGIAEFSVYVARERRGTGAGSAAMHGLIAAAGAAGFWKLTSRVFVENAASRALMRRCGFREVGVLERHARLDGVWRDVVLVERLLA